MPPAVEARIVEMRLAHPRWGPRTIAHYLAREELERQPSRSSIYRCLVRHRLIDPQKRRRKREDYRRWERLKAMELWQMDVMGGVKLSDESELKLVSGIDDHSRFCVSAQLVERATTRPVCEALRAAMQRHGVPEQILTDNGKVFTGRFGAHRREVLFDRICQEHGVRHLLTAPYSPTTTGKVERFHKTLRSEFLEGRTFASLEAAQAELDAWVAHYNCERPHQGIGMVAPIKRFELAARGQQPVARQPEAEAVEAKASGEQHPAEGEVVTRRVREGGRISLEGFDYRHITRHYAPETNGVVERFNRSLEYEHLYQREIETAADLAEEVAAYLSLYSEIRPHQTFEQRRPLAVHCLEPHPTGGFDTPAVHHRVVLCAPFERTPTRPGATILQPRSTRLDRSGGAEGSDWTAPPAPETIAWPGFALSDCGPPKAMTEAALGRTCEVDRRMGSGQWGPASSRV